MFAPGHNFTPTMPMKYTVHLRTPNAFFCLFTKLLKKLSFFLYAHVSAVSKIMLFRYSLGVSYVPRIFDHLRVRKNDRLFRSAGFGEGTPQQVLTGTEEAKAEIWATGRYLL